MTILKELIEQQNDYLPLLEALEESFKSVQLQKRGGKVSSAIKGAKDFFKSNPGLVVGVAAMAVSAYDKYKRNQHNTIKLHGKTPYEKRMMTSIVDALTQSGKFKIKRIKFENGGKTWILKRKWK